MRADILRSRFLSFFKSKKHKIVQSDSLVPKEDPTVLFTPAGMNQFKKEFLGYNSGFKRAATCQRCLRTDDLDKVGKTLGHHTFFEMLGNFSFGDYFKKEAIAFAWEFLAQELQIKKEKLWVSVYEEDSETYNIWKDKIRVSQEKIIKLGDKENFWPSEAKEKGPNGPCGPCSEIFFDWGTDTGCKRADCNPSCNCGRFVEVWNLVFTQFNRKDGGVLEPLPKKNIDTGMGLERLAAVMQGVHSNFSTDLFKPIIKEITNYQLPITNYGLINAIADHIRAIAFAIYDGVLPSNEARGYVIRKLIRKSVLHLRALGIQKPFLYKLVPVLAQIMKEPYPEMKTRKENIAEIILAEERSFISTLNSSDAIIGEKLKYPVSNLDSEKIGTIAFQLYDTHGIPPELTVVWAHKEGIKISEEVFNKGFNKALDEQKTRSKLQSTMKAEVFGVANLSTSVTALLRDTQFIGYKKYSVKAKILKIIKGREEIKVAKQGDEVNIILDKTPFYPESGGQIGDKGGFVKGKNIFEVLDTQKLDRFIIHVGEVKIGNFKKGDSVKASIDVERRLSIARNHTATHLLQAALRKVLGQHVKQQGSLVAQDKLRFDFTHFKDIDQPQLDRIEEVVNGYIINNYPLDAQQMPLSEAKRGGALAFFAEKYENKVRVISIEDFSKELCAGTHLKSTGEIGMFKIVHEGSVASGIRRIEAVTGNQAFKIIKEEEREIKDISSMLGVPEERIVGELEKKLARIKDLKKKLSLKTLDMLKNSLDTLIQNAPVLNGIKVITAAMESIDMDLLRKAVDSVKRKTNNAIIALASSGRDRVLLVMGITADLCAKGWDASKLILNVASVINGSGAGRADFAQAGGNKPANIEAAFKELNNIIANLK